MPSKRTRAESPAQRRARAGRLVTELAAHYPEAHCALQFTNPLELLIATILSAQCTDERVNRVTAQLFKKYPTAQKYATAPVAELEEAIHSTGFFRNKAKNIRACCEVIAREYRGQVPRTLEELTALPGVGRKTANVVLGNAFAIASGIVVDTHVTRLCNRLGLVKTEDAVKIERELVELVPVEHWIQFSHWLIQHGRTVCSARKPDCKQCFLAPICPQRL